VRGVWHGGFGDHDQQQLVDVGDVQRTAFCLLASLLAALDVHPRVAMRFLRHSKIAVTMEIYTEALSEANRDALRKLSDWLA
jgi:integrase